jgi:hypothetical protein
LAIAFIVDTRVVVDWRGAKALSNRALSLGLALVGR